MSMRIHISVGVSDLDASIQFYSQVFGVEPSKRKDDYANFRLDAPPIHLALVPRGQNASVKHRQGIEHFGVELPDQAQFEAHRDAARARGLEMVNEENTTCCYAKADKFWLTDPDGYRWEFWVRKSDADAMFEAPPAPKSAPKSTCCPR